MGVAGKDLLSLLRVRIICLDAVLQNKCLDILTPLEAVLNLNKVSFFFKAKKNNNIISEH